VVDLDQAQPLLNLLNVKYLLASPDISVAGNPISASLIAAILGFGKICRCGPGLFCKIKWCPITSNGTVHRSPAEKRPTAVYRHDPGKEIEKHNPACNGWKPRIHQRFISSATKLSVVSQFQPSLTFTRHLREWCASRKDRQKILRPWSNK